MFKVLVGKAELGGSLSYQKDLVAKANADLESQLNSNDITEVSAVSIYQTEHDLQVVAVVKISEPKKKKKSSTKKKGA